MFRRIILVSSVILIVALTALFLSLRGCSALNGGGIHRGGAEKKVAASNSSSLPARETHVEAGTVADTPLGAAILDAERALKDGADAKTVLAELRKKLLDDPKAASAAISAYLASGRDAATGLPFVVGRNGEIVSAASLREYLLDLLLTVDPQAALAEAEAVFEAKISADEYAICLRNVGKIDTSVEGRAYVAQRARELLSDAKLSSSPTAGFVESFDAIVYGGNSDDLKLLAQYADADKGIGLNMPAFLAMDHMVISDTAASLQEFLDDPSLLDERPLTRAGFFARADLSDAEQLAEVVQYVQRLNPSSEEATYFFSLVPNVNYTLTDGILTDRVSLSADYVQSHFDSALSTVDSWLGDRSFAKFSTLLETAKTRLESQMGK